MRMISVSSRHRRNPRKYTEEQERMVKTLRSSQFRVDILLSGIKERFEDLCGVDDLDTVIRLLRDVVRPEMQSFEETDRLFRQSIRESDQLDQPITSEPA